MKSPLNYKWLVACMSTQPDLFGPYTIYMTFQRGQPAIHRDCDNAVILISYHTC